MAYDYIYWPLDLPRKTLLDSFSPRASASVLRTSTDAGVPLQRGMGDYPLDPVSCAYIMTRAQVETFQRFCRLHAGRSFWMPYPDPLHSGYARDKWWYARISQQDQNAAATITAEGGGMFKVPLTLEFWVGVPGVAAPGGGGMMPATIITSAQIQAWLAEDDGLTPDLLEAMSLPETDDGLVLLLDIYGAGQTEPFYVSSNPSQYLRMNEETKEPIYGHVHAGREYIYCPFQFELYSEEEGGEVTSCRLALQNVDETVTVALRTVTVALDFRLRIVSLRQPGTVQMDIDFLKLTSAAITRETVTGELASYDYGAEPCAPNYTLGEYRTLGNRS